MIPYYYHHYTQIKMFKTQFRDSLADNVPKLMQKKPKKKTPLISIIIIICAISKINPFSLHQTAAQFE